MSIKLIYKILYLFTARIKHCKYCKMDFTVKLSPESTFEGMSKIHRFTTFHGHLGFGSYIGPHCYLSASIGRFTSIARNVSSNPGVHPYHEPFVSTSPCFYSLNPNHSQSGSTFATEQLFQEERYFDASKRIAISIGNDCWIGEGVFFVGGIIIGDGAMVLAHAVVTKNVPPYAIVGGVPAKIIGYRFDEETIKFLLNIRWWENSPEWFKMNWRLLNDINALKTYYSSK